MVLVIGEGRHVAHHRRSCRHAEVLQGLASAGLWLPEGDALVDDADPAGGDTVSLQHLGDGPARRDHPLAGAVLPPRERASQVEVDPPAGQEPGSRRKTRCQQSGRDRMGIVSVDHLGPNLTQETVESEGRRGQIA